MIKNYDRNSKRNESRYPKNIRRQKDAGIADQSKKQYGISVKSLQVASVDFFINDTNNY